MSYAQIWYNRQKYGLPLARHQGQNLRGFFGVRANHDLFRESDTGDDVLIRDDETQYEVKDRDKFYSAARAINQS